MQIKVVFHQIYTSKVLHVTEGVLLLMLMQLHKLLVAPEGTEPNQ